MEIRYIFLLKREKTKTLNKNEEHKDFLNENFKNIKRDKFDIEYNDKIYTIDYKANYIQESTFSLIISIDSNEENKADILHEVNNRICKNPKRREYNIIKTYDGLSEFYSNKSIIKLNYFERKLRELIYIIVVKSFGVGWYEKTIKEELGKKIKKTSGKNNLSTLIESALHEMTLGDLELYLFEPYTDKNINTLIEDIENSSSYINDKTKDEILSMILKYKPKCLWKRFFEDIIDIDIEDIKYKLTEIRKYRNKVAHNKDFYIEDYKNCKSILDEVNEKLNIAVENLYVKEFNQLSIYHSRAAFNNIKDKVSEKMNSSQNKTLIPDIIKEIKKREEMVKNISFVPNIVKQAMQGEEVIKNISALPGITKLAMEKKRY